MAVLLLGRNNMNNLSNTQVYIFSSVLWRWVHGPRVLLASPERKTTSTGSLAFSRAILKQTANFLSNMVTKKYLKGWVARIHRDFVEKERLFHKGICHKEGVLCPWRLFALRWVWSSLWNDSLCALHIPSVLFQEPVSGLSKGPCVQESIIVRTEKYALGATGPLLLFHSRYHCFLLGFKLCIPQICWSRNARYLWIWTYLETVVADVTIGSSGWPLIQH